MKRIGVCAALAATLFSAALGYAITIETVPVGDLGNPNDPATGNLFGGVGYAYNIGKYEVTVGQYTAFLNAVAATDTYNLYNTSMATNLNIARISRTGSSGSYSYSVIDSPNAPITLVGWGDAARFANWLHNGQPSGAQALGTTESGAYSLNGATSSAALLAVTRNPGATWFIPSENEWYKAAYYQPPAAQGGDADSYWSYPMRTNSDPYSDQPPGATPDNTRVGNFIKDDGVTNGYDDGFAVTGTPQINSSQYYLTDVGAYTSSPSYYGTFDQGGNAFEWNEANFFNLRRGLRGGTWVATAGILNASARDDTDPNNESGSFGFRVATIAVPEQCTTTFAILGLGAMVRFHRRQRAR
jgi:sulfatase modifying factor 1